MRMKNIKILNTKNVKDETERILRNPVMTRRLNESIKNIEQGNVIAIKLKDLWK